MQSCTGFGERMIDAGDVLPVDGRAAGFRIDTDQGDRDFGGGGKGRARRAEGKNRHVEFIDRPMTVTISAADIRGLDGAAIGCDAGHIVRAAGDIGRDVAAVLLGNFDDAGGAATRQFFGVGGERCGKDKQNAGENVKAFHHALILPARL